jgi:hypothetical protein
MEIRATLVRGAGGNPATFQGLLWPTPLKTEVKRPIYIDKHRPSICSD